MRFDIEHLLQVAKRIEHGIRDHQTGQSCFKPLWDYGLILDTLIKMLEAKIRGEHPQDYQKTFEVVCGLLCPEFLRVVIA